MKFLLMTHGLKRIDYEKAKLHTERAIIILASMNMEGAPEWLKEVQSMLTTV